MRRVQCVHAANIPDTVENLYGLKWYSQQYQKSVDIFVFEILFTEQNILLIETEVTIL